MPSSESSAAQDQDTVLAVYTVVVRVPKEIGTGWSVYAIDTKNGYLDDIVAYGVIEVPDAS